jgi:hypothetical protein
LSKAAVDLADSESPDDPDEIEAFFSDHGFEWVDFSEKLTSAADSDEDKFGEYAISQKGAFNAHMYANTAERLGLPRVVDALNAVMWPSLARKDRGGLSNKLAKLASQGLDDVSFAHVSGETDHIQSLFSVPGGEVAQKDLDALEAWLDSDVDPWSAKDRDRTDLKSTADTAGSMDAHFEDNFTDFVSASSQPHVFVTKDDDDPDLPTQAEIQAASQKIFGATAGVPGAFDVSHVFSVLESMKEEIGGINDEDERRRAAARVALGFVAGLGYEDQEDGDDGAAAWLDASGDYDALRSVVTNDD